MTTPTALTHCRICGNADLVLVLDLGQQMLTGVFPRTRDTDVTIGPLQLVKCMGAAACGLLQLAHSYDAGEMYGENYGYRSGLNSSMVAHLREKVSRLQQRLALRPGDLVVDIGSNDGTTLAAYPDDAGLDLLGIDPTAEKFREYYKSGIHLCAAFFSADTFRRVRPGKSIRILTSFSMFYDLEAPMEFMRDVHNVLADDGLWVFEQSYMPAMLAKLSYDTVCHEHLEYYALRQVKWMTDRTGFTIVDVEFNEVNGGSFSVTVAKTASDQVESREVVGIITAETAAGLDTLKPFSEFAQRAAASRAEFRAFIDGVHAAGGRIAALGASTKGNVLLQYCNISPEDIKEVGEVNPEKFGALTPGTWLPIRAEAEVLADRFEFLVVLPWHFRPHFLQNPAYAGRKLVFPLPALEVIQAGRHDESVQHDE